MNFSICDISDEQYEKNKLIAYKKYKLGEKPTFSQGICESVTAGYGNLDNYGYFEYPLNVNQKSLKIIPW